ncbi:MAG: APC family permease [Candidatus Bathyarchaeia archaeon]
MVLNTERNYSDQAESLSNPSDTSAKRPVFLREATGLVRALGFRDHFFMSQGMVLLINGFVATVLFAPYFFPGANLYVAFALGGIPPFCMAYVYGKLSAGMPRSGGDYVWSARITGPLYATIQMIFILSGLIYFNAFNIWQMFFVALGAGFFGVGASPAVQSTFLTQLGIQLTQVTWGLPLSMVMMGVILLVAFLGIRVYQKFCLVAVPIYFVITLVFCVGILMINPSSVQPTFDSAMRFAGYNITYNSVLAQTTAGGFPATSFNWTNTLLAAVPWGFLTYVLFNFSSYSAGETKNVKTSIYNAYLLSVIVTMVALEVMTWIVYSVFSTGFINSLAYVAGATPSAFPVSPFPNFLLALSNPAAGALVAIGLFVGWMINSTGIIIYSSRMLFAASMDRVLPSRLGDVDDRFHIPWVATLVMGVICGIYLWFYWAYGAIAAILNASITVPIGLALPLYAAFLFPIVKPNLYKRLFGSMKGAATLSTAGFVGGTGFAIYVFSETSPLVSGAFLGASIYLAYEVVLVLLLASAGIYLLGRRRMKNAGIDPSLIFSEIPPE